MAADNDLDYFAIQNINQMERCFSENQVTNGVYVYVDKVMKIIKPLMCYIK